VIKLNVYFAIKVLENTKNGMTGKQEKVISNVIKKIVNGVI
tara:strand:+ start:103 stop:225 length:123 start_codon:yes stop_codon:yes gene_type:complete